MYCMYASAFYSVSSPVCGATIVSASELGGVCKAYEATSWSYSSSPSSSKRSMARSGTKK